MADGSIQKSTPPKPPARRRRGGQVTAPQADEQLDREQQAVAAAENPIAQRFAQTEQTVTGLLNARDAYLGDRTQAVGEAFLTMESDLLLGVADYLTEAQQSRGAVGNAPFQRLVDDLAAFSHPTAPAETEG